MNKTIIILILVLFLSVACLPPIYHVSETDTIEVGARHCFVEMMTSTFYRIEIPDTLESTNSTNLVSLAQKQDWITFAEVTERGTVNIFVTRTLARPIPEALGELCHKLGFSVHYDK